MKNLCDGCIYKGNPLEHLAGHEGVEVWTACHCPVPYWVTPRAVPNAEHNAKEHCSTKVPNITRRGDEHL